MAQMTWYYLDDAGNRHRVGLYHGDRTGHLLIYCNTKVMQVEFSVKDTNYYSFFIEEELCEVHVVKEPDGRFGYEFKINKTVDTPLNQHRKKQLLLERKQLGIGLVLMVLFLAGMLAFNRSQKNLKTRMAASERSVIGDLSAEEVDALKTRGKSATATFYLLQENNKTVARYTIMTADSLQISGKIVPLETEKIYLPNGFEITDRNQFKAEYLPDDPGVHRILFYLPSNATIQEYLKNAITVQQLLHQEFTPEYNRCLIEAIQQVHGWQVLSHIINQDTDRKEEKNRYLRLIRDPEVDRMVKQNCGI